MIRSLSVAVAALACLSACDQGGGGTREGIWAAGSSTVFPFTTRVAENFSRANDFAMPRVESLGTGGGSRAGCKGHAAGPPWCG